MEDKRYRSLVRIALALTVAWVGWTLYDSELSESSPTALELAAAGRYLEDDNFSEALRAFKKASALAPDNIGALRGQAQTLTRMGIKASRESIVLAKVGKVEESRTTQQNAAEHMQMALQTYNLAIARTKQIGISDLNRRAAAVSFANRGILKDQQGDHSGALTDYEQAMKLEASVTDGPGFLTRFMRNQSEVPPNVGDRAKYLRQQLALPANKRILRLPTIDAQQHAYQVD